MNEMYIFDFFANHVNFWLNNYLDSYHSQGVWNLPHKFHLYLIILLKWIMMSQKTPKHMLDNQNLLEL